MADALDPSPELVVQAAYIRTFHHLRRLIIYVAVALVVFAGVSVYALLDAAHVRTVSHRDTQNQIQELACGLADQVPPGNQLADSIRSKYACGPYVPPKAVVQPKSPQ